MESKAKEDDGWIALWSTASKGRDAVERLLLENRANVDAKDNKIMFIYFRHNNRETSH